MPAAFASELIPMRPDERIDPVRVAQALRGKIPGADGVPEVLQFAGGKANLTFLLRFSGAGGVPVEYVLRRPPLGPVAPKSHDMSREYTVLSVLYQAYPLAPRAFYFSEDPSVVGAPFLVMERRRGLVIREEMPAEFQNRPELNRRISEMLADALADLHSVDPAAIGLGGLGKPEGFMVRQIQGWAGRWEAAKTGEVPQFDAVRRWLEAHTPLPQRASLVHNDFKLDNMMVEARDPGHPVAVFDWDMCTLGDPLSDLGTLLGYYTESGDSESRRAFSVMPTHQPGFLTRAQLALRYGARCGLDLSALGFYEAFALWKTAVVIQQIYVRWHRGQTRDSRFESYGARALELVTAAWECTQRPA